MPTILDRSAIYHNPDSFFRYVGWPTVAADDEGTLYAVCSGFRARHICPFGKTVMFKSFDEGKTWSIPMVINDTYLDDRDAGIVCLGGRTMLVSWFSHPAEVYQHRYHDRICRDWVGSSGVLDAYDSIPDRCAEGGSFVRVSHDGGMTWGETTRVPVSAPHGPIVLADGTIFYLGKEMYTHGEETPGAIAAWISRDEGRTWQRRGSLNLPTGTSPANFHEPYAIETRDGRILGFIRAQGKEVTPALTVYQAVSTDGGASWSEMTPLGISGTPPHLLRHSSGAIILSYARREVPCGERAVVSLDEGATWSEEIVLHSAPNWDIGYPSTVELRDGSLLTVYYQQYGEEAFPSLCQTVWRL